MKATHIVRSFVVLTILGSLIGAQTPAAGKPAASKPAQAPAQKPAQTQPKEAGAMKAEPVQLKFNVSGLTKDNVAKVKETLGGLSAQMYTCASCKVKEAAAGSCPKCKGQLKAEKVALLASVTTSAEDSSVAVTIDPANGPVRFSDLETTLGKDSVKIDPAKFPVAGKSNLIVKGATADAAPALEKALTDAKLFDDVKATFDATTSEIQIHVRAGASAPTRAKVAAAIEGSGTKAMLTDIVWGRMAKSS